VVRTMSKEEVVELVDKFNQMCVSAQSELEELRRMAEVEMPNIFGHVNGLSFDIFDIRIFPPKYLTKILFDVEDVEIYTISFDNSVISMWFKDASARMFKYQIDLSSPQLKLWEYYLLILMMQTREFQDKMREHISAINAVNTTLTEIIQFITKWNNQQNSN